MRRTTEPKASPANDRIEDLSIAALPQILKKLELDPQALSVEAFARSLHKALKPAETRQAVTGLIETLPVVGKRDQSEEQTLDVDAITRRLAKLSTKAGALEDLSMRFAETVFLAGNGKPAHVTDETYGILQKVGGELVELRDASKGARPPKATDALETLTGMHRELVEFAASNEKLKVADFVALNDQYEKISRTLTRERAAAVDTLPAKVKEPLLSDGIMALSSVPASAVKHIDRLCAAGVLERSEVSGTGTVIALRSGDVKTETFEALIPPRVRESICREISRELRLKYSGKCRELGTTDTRPHGAPTLRDSVRLGQIAEKAGVSESLVTLTLDYLHQHGLVRPDANGYSLSGLGARYGTGMGAVRFVQRGRAFAGSEASEESPDGRVSVDQYLDAARKARESWKMPEYSFKTKDGGAPWVYLVDELFAGNARIDTGIIRQLMSDIKKTPEGSALVITSNMLQGDPAVEMRAARTAIRPEDTGGVDLRDYGNQVRFLKEFLKELGHPAIQLHGKNDLETANLKADVQRVRDQEAIRGETRSDEGTIRVALSRLNEISERAGRKYNAKLQAELLEFTANVVMPLEFKLGRELMGSNEVYEQAGLEMNELEIVRDIISIMAEEQARGTGQGPARVNALYGEFLALPEVGASYLDRISEVVNPSLESIQGGSAIARGGAKIQLVTPDGRNGLSLLCLPEARFGVSEMAHPTEKITQVLKSRTLSGKDMPDIVCVGSTGVPYVSMTAGGILIASADTLQASNFDDLYGFTEAQDRHKRRRYVRGGESGAGSIAFSGGVNDGLKTDAYTLRLWNGKIQQVLEANAEQGKPSRYVDIYSTSDFQTGSPTAKPSTWLRGLFWAVANDQKEIVINGDVFQGQNYGRAVAEMQLTGLVGIEDQQAFVHALLNPVLDAIKERKLADPTWELPKFKILAGNHETNSQSGKGGQGIWFLQTVSSQIESFYRGAFGQEVAESHVLYPKKFVDRMGVDVDYSHVVLDYSDETGFRIAAQHYVGAGGKGSSVAPPIASAKTWGRAMENELRPVHGFLFGHWHTQSVTQSDGVFYAIFGANADKSGFEWHLGYPTTVPASGRVRLYSDRPPELFFVTDPYLRLQEKELGKLPAFEKLIRQHGSVEAFVEYERARHQRRDQKSFSYKELKLEGTPHRFLDAHRNI